MISKLGSFSILNAIQYSSFYLDELHFSYDEFSLINCRGAWSLRFQCFFILRASDFLGRKYQIVVHCVRFVTEILAIENFRSNTKMSP